MRKYNFKITWVFMSDGGKKTCNLAEKEDKVVQLYTISTRKRVNKTILV